LLSLCARCGRYYVVIPDESFVLHERNDRFIWDAPNQGIGIGGNLKYYVGGTFRRGRQGKYDNLEISNVRDFKEIMTDIFDGQNYVSNFFNINPDGTQPDNLEYDFAEANTHELGIIQAYDVIRASAYEDSWGASGNIDFEKFIKDLNVMFNMLLIYYPSENLVRHEHITYFRQKGIDLSEGKDYDLKPLQFNKDSIKSERWSMPAPLINPAHFETEIKYQNDSIKNEEYAIDLVLTDVLSALDNENYNEPTTFGKLFFLVSIENGALVNFNENLAIKNLVKTLHRQGRPYQYGKQDGENAQFINASLGLSSEISFSNTLKSFLKLYPQMGIKVREYTFYIESLEIDQSDTITCKLIR